MVKEGHNVPTLQIAIGKQFQCPGCVTAQQRAVNADDGVAAGYAQRFGDLSLVNVAVGGHTAVQQADGVAHTAVAQPRQQGRSLRLQRKALFGGNLAQACGNDLRGNSTEIIPLTAGQNGGRHLVQFGGSQDKQNVGGGLFQRLQQRVECTGGQHVHLIDDVYTALHGGGGKGTLLANLADVVHAVVAGGVDLGDVQRRFL